MVLSTVKKHYKKQQSWYNFRGWSGAIVLYVFVDGILYNKIANLEANDLANKGIATDIAALKEYKTQCELE